MSRDRRTSFGRRLVAESRPLRVAYADPPYVGVADRYPEKTEVDHAELIARLEADYPDGWALSAGVNSLRALLPLAPAAARVAAWCKPFYGYKPGVAPSYAWEPVIYVGGRRRHRLDGGPRDWVVCNPAMGRAGRPAYTVLGQKPAEFCLWLFQLLNIGPGDALADLYPGSGGVSRAWNVYCEDLRAAPLQLEAECL